MLQKNVGELFSNVVEVICVSKTEVVDAIAEIENVPLHFQSYDDVFVLVSGNVEISWHSIDLEEAMEVAALIFIQLFSDSVFNLSTPNIFVHCIFSRNHFSILRETALEQLTHDISPMRAKNIFDVK